MQIRLFALLFFVILCCILECNYGEAFLIRSCPKLPRSIMSKCSRGRRVGSRCTLKCPPGFVLFRAGSVVTCRSNRQWRGIDIRQARCDRRRRPLCPPLPETFQSKCTRGRLVGSSCSLSCPTRYDLQGPDKIRCQPNRKWSTDPSTIRCERIIDPRCPPRRLANVLCPAEPSPDAPECPENCTKNEICCPIGCLGFSCTPIPPECPRNQPQADCRELPCNSETCPRFPNAFCFDSGCGGCTGIFTASGSGVIPRFSCALGSKWPECLKSRRCPGRVGQRCRFGCPGHSNKRCVQSCSCRIIYLDATTGKTLTREQCRSRRPPVPPRPPRPSRPPRPHPSCPPPKPSSDPCPTPNMAPKCPPKCPRGEVCCPTSCGGTMCKKLGIRIPLPPPKRCPLVPLRRPDECLRAFVSMVCRVPCRPNEECCPNGCGGSTCTRITKEIISRCPSTGRVGICTKRLSSSKCPPRCPEGQRCCRNHCGGFQCKEMQPIDPSCPMRLIPSSGPGSCTPPDALRRCPQLCGLGERCCPNQCGGTQCTRIIKRIPLACPRPDFSGPRCALPKTGPPRCPPRCPGHQVCCPLRCGGTDCVDVPMA